ncbi:MAG: type II toxin-antitoxin system RelE/ParE family toxin [Acidobacteria bacterium]|nr:type II toxin-antitoxin system RelE/ParE family toxin [Acidobacteriota bacterium]
MANLKPQGMTSYRFSSRAFRDLIEIGEYISADDADAARAVVRAIYKTCRSIAASPFAGILRTDLTPLPVRFRLLLPYRTYWIIYDPTSKPIEIVRILHTSMDIPAALR